MGVVHGLGVSILDTTKQISNRPKWQTEISGITLWRLFFIVSQSPCRKISLLSLLDDAKYTYIACKKQMTLSERFYWNGVWHKLTLALLLQRSLIFPWPNTLWVRKYQKRIRFSVSVLVRLILPAEMLLNIVNYLEYYSYILSEKRWWII